MSDTYRVELDSFHGPMDLLLYLVQREEVEIENLPIARLTEQYLAYVEGLEEVDVDAAGDYLVMATQLLQIKARALLPDLPPQVDPNGETLTKDDLVKDLLAYRELREQADLLEAREGAMRRHFARESPRRFEEVPLREVDVWDLVTRFRLLEDQISTRAAQTREIAADEDPVKDHVARLRERLLAAVSGLSFAELFDEAPRRQAMVSTFLALLELIRLCEVRAVQDGPFGEIRIVPVPLEARAALRPVDAVDAGSTAAS